MKTSGILNVWFESRDFGFIHVEKADVILSLFLHRANIKSGTPRTGATVLFKSVVTRKGYLAVDAEVVDGGAK
jgi:cold shock CspA family protein